MDMENKNRNMELIELLENMGVEWTEEDRKFLMAIQDKEKRKLVISILTAT